MAFTQLDQHINKALTACGYKNPTPIQAKSIPTILEGRDLVASSQTGSGKTAAFVLPALHFLGTQKPSKQTRILILTPTRELASQITKAAHKYGKFLRFNIISLVGGMPYGPQIRDLSRGADIIVATPGRLMDHIEQSRVNLSSIEMLILDEADRMLDMGFIDDVEYIAKLTPNDRQTLLFSATVDKKLTSIVRHLLKNPVRIDLSHEKIAPTQIKQELYKASSTQHKTRLLKHFLNDENIYKAIIFSATKMNADKLAHQLRDEGYAAAALHGDLRQNVRNRTIEQLRCGKIQFLVATDVAARGIDITDVTHVINYDLPRFCEDYVHRIGRTGRAGKNGVAISFVLPTDTRHLQSIERYLGQRLKLISHVEIQENTPIKKENRPAFEHQEQREPQHKKRSSFEYQKRKNGTQHKNKFEHKPRNDRNNRHDDGRSFEHSRKKKFAGEARREGRDDAHKTKPQHHKKYFRDKPFAKKKRAANKEQWAE